MRGTNGRDREKFAQRFRRHPLIGLGWHRKLMTGPEGERGSAWADFQRQARTDTQGSMIRPFQGQAACGNRRLPRRRSGVRRSFRPGRSRVGDWARPPTCRRPCVLFRSKPCGAGAAAADAEAWTSWCWHGIPWPTVADRRRFVPSTAPVPWAPGRSGRRQISDDERRNRSSSLSAGTIVPPRRTRRERTARRSCSRSKRGSTWPTRAWSRRTGRA